MCNKRIVPRFSNTLGLVLSGTVLLSIGVGCGDGAATSKSFDQAKNEDSQFKESMAKSMDRYKSMTGPSPKRKGAGRKEAR